MAANEPVIESRSMLWVLVPVLFALLVAAVVGLPLFQDGSSYLLEMLITHSVIRNGRFTILLFQLPTIILIKTFLRLGIDTLTTLPIVRLAFNLNYALTPFISLFLSWLIVRKKREELLIWAALIILFVNLVNFSWVSELLISVQFACPLLLALLLGPRSKTFWILFVILVPFTFFLHPLVLTLYLVMAGASAYIGYWRPADRRAAGISTILFLLAAAARGIYSFFSLSSYEMTFAATGEVRNYFMISGVENLFFIGTAAELALLILLTKWLVNTESRIVKALFWLVSLQALFLFFLTGRLLLQGNTSFVVSIAGIIPLFLVYLYYSRASSFMQNIRLLYISYFFLAMTASGLLLAQHALNETPFILKMGSDLFVVLFIMIMAVIDSVRKPMAREYTWRFRFLIALSVIYLGVLLAKSIMWQTSIQRLEQTLQQTQGTCTELTPANYQWLENTPYTILNNWAVSSLALIIQDQQPRKLLLAPNDCQLFYQTGEVQIDPWSRFSQKYIVPPLE